MTTYLSSILLPLTSGSDRMLQTDPHGYTLTVIAVGVVFIALIILYFIYNLSGNIFSGKLKREIKHLKPKGKSAEGEVATAIALALRLESEAGGEAQAAIATALHLYLSSAVHDYEPGFITIRPREASRWGLVKHNERKTPRQ